MRDAVPDARARWRRWVVPRGSVPWMVALSIAWFAAGLCSLIAAEFTYGWRAAPISHAWHAAAYLTFIGWCLFGRLLHDRRGR